MESLQRDLRLLRCCGMRTRLGLRGWKGGSLGTYCISVFCCACGCPTEKGISYLDFRAVEFIISYILSVQSVLFIPARKRRYF
jgi:hypothetical protein